ncbi:MAG TPA: hypothetical protein VNR87_09955 [Flavisolibacter sp.]|nr:hypothetical protein [Flavisolibacter sp.]
MEKPQDIENLFRRYLLDQCSPDEMKRLAGYFSVEANEDELKSLIRKEFESNNYQKVEPDPLVEKKMAQVLEKLKKQIRRK